MAKKKKKKRASKKKKKETKAKAKKVVSKAIKDKRKADMIAEAIAASKKAAELIAKYDAMPEKILNDVKATRSSDPLMSEEQKTRENAVQVYIKEQVNHSELIQLPVVPSSFEVQSGQNNQTANVNAAGEVNLVGKRALKTVDLQAFFPAQDYNFLVCERKSDPYAYIRWLEKRKNEGTVLRVIITGTGVNMACLIDDLKYGEDDATGDVNFTISLKEYRTLKAARINKNTASGKSKSKKKNSNIYITKKGDTIKKIAKKKLGSASKGKKLYKKNKKAIEKAFKKWIKEENKRRKKAGKKKLKWKNSKKGKHLAPGTRIVLK